MTAVVGDDRLRADIYRAALRDILDLADSGWPSHSLINAIREVVEEALRDG